VSATSATCTKLAFLLESFICWQWLYTEPGDPELGRLRKKMTDAWAKLDVARFDVLRKRVAKVLSNTED
jgi:hypothetical protein